MPETTKPDINMVAHIVAGLAVLWALGNIAMGL